MSQVSNYDIADGSGATVLAELAAALKAANSLNAGPSAPATTYAYQFWADTTNNLLKQRDAGNANWIVLGPLLQPLNSGAVVTKTAAYTVTLADSVLLGDTTGGAFTFTLPVASTCSGKEYTFKKLDASLVNFITINPVSGAQIDGAANLILYLPNWTVKIISDGTNWRIMSKSWSSSMLIAGQIVLNATGNLYTGFGEGHNVASTGEPLWEHVAVKNCLIRNLRVNVSSYTSGNSALYVLKNASYTAGYPTVAISSGSPTPDVTNVVTYAPGDTMALNMISTSPNFTFGAQVELVM